MQQIDPKTFRSALGSFATGVTVVTTADENGVKAGVTASSFNSVSLDPPMVLWSLAKNSRSLDAFQLADGFAVHILAADQKDLSARFASQSGDKYEGLAHTMSKTGNPHLGTCLARFDCSTAHQYDGGDHIIFVGHVLEFEAADAEPLLFHKGVYASVGAAD